MYHKLCAQLITAKSICEYGRIDHSYFQANYKTYGIIKTKLLRRIPANEDS